MFDVIVVDRMELEFTTIKDYLEWCRLRGWDNYSVTKDEGRWFFFFKKNLQVRTEKPQERPLYSTWKKI